jgi:hypothetical protein
MNEDSCSLFLAACDLKVTQAALISFERWLLTFAYTEQFKVTNKIIRALCFLVTIFLWITKLLSISGRYIKYHQKCIL